MATVFLSESKLLSNYSSLKNALPGVDLYYACKTNSDKNLLQILGAAGCKFDIATDGEVHKLMAAGVTIDQNRTIHTHPIKTISDIVHTLDYGCTTFVVDNIDEIKKFETLLVHRRKKLADHVLNPDPTQRGKAVSHLNPEVLIRIAIHNPDAGANLSAKFGCDINDFEKLYSYCKSIGLRVRGISFHAGSNCKTAEVHADAIRKCIPLFKKHSLRTLDIGGGFPAIPADNNIGRWCEPIRRAIDDFKISMIGNWDVAPEIIAEPGRYIAASCMSMECEVVGKSLKGDTMWYYLDDGVYGMMSGVIYDHNRYDLVPHNDQYDLFRTKYKSVFAGPTCDSIDVVLKDVVYEELDIGDKLTVNNIGAYSVAHATTFNSLPIPLIRVVK